MKQISLLLITVILVASGVQAQTASQSQSASWMTYTVKDAALSVDLPDAPAMTVNLRGVSMSQVGRRPPRREISIGSYADGVVYSIYVLENPKPRQSLDAFIQEQTRSHRNRYIQEEQQTSLDGTSGKTLLFQDRDGMSQFFAKDDRLYEFRAMGVGVDDLRMTRFFSSLSFKHKKGTEVKEGTGLPSEAESSDDANQKPMSGKEVEKKVRLGMKPEPSYTDSARQNSVTGTVLIKCVFRRDGRVTDIQVVRGLPHGLTERAVEAAKKIKFIPATKDGHYVSMWMQLEYYFNLY